MPPEERRPVTEDGEATSTTQEPAAAAAAARAHELEEVGPTSATRRFESWRRFLSAIYSAPDCEAEYCDERVRLSVCMCVSVCDRIFGTTRPIFAKFYLRVTCGRGSVLLRCDVQHNGLETFPGARSRPVGRVAPVRHRSAAAAWQQQRQLTKTPRQPRRSLLLT